MGHPLARVMKEQYNMCKPSYVLYFLCVQQGKRYFLLPYDSLQIVLHHPHHTIPHRSTPTPTHISLPISSTSTSTFSPPPPRSPPRPSPSPTIKLKPKRPSHTNHPAYSTHTTHTPRQLTQPHRRYNARASDQRSQQAPRHKQTCDEWQQYLDWILLQVMVEIAQECAYACDEACD